MRRREVERAAKAIRAACLKRPDLVLPRFRGTEERYGGFCYVATQAFCHLTGAEPYVLSHPVMHDGKVEVVEHFYAVLNGEVWDLTAEQFDDTPNYDWGRRARHRMTMRTQDLLLEV